MISIAILCGGKSERFGADKSLHKIGNKTIVEIIFNKFKNHTDDIFLQLTKRDPEPSKVFEFSENIKFDIINEKGPLGGIFSALNHAKHNQIFIVAGDLINIEKNIIDELAKFIDYNLVVPKWDDNLVEPLCAIYSKNILPVIETQINANDLKINNLFKIIEKEYLEKYRIKYVNINDLIDENRISQSCFQNINTIKDLALNH